MFEAYAGHPDPQSTRRFLAATGMVASAILLVSLGASLTPNAPVIEPLVEEKVDVRFRPPPPPPPPAPKIEAASPPPVAAAPPPPKAVTPIAAPVAAAPPAAPAPLVAPKEVPTTQAPEASEEQAVTAIAVAVGGVGDGSGNGSPEGVAGGTGTTAGAPVATARPINLPENAIPPKPLQSNRAPEYPAEAKAAGLEETVILKVVVSAKGEVTAMKLMRGSEPFASAAGRAVKTWRFEPALVEGRPTSVFRVIRIPFRIRS